MLQLVEVSVLRLTLFCQTIVDDVAPFHLGSYAGERADKLESSRHNKKDDAEPSALVA